MLVLYVQHHSLYNLIVLSRILNFNDSSKEHQFFATVGFCYVIQCFEYFLWIFFFIGTFQNNGAIHVVFLIWLLLIVWRLKTEWVQIILTSCVGGYIFISVTQKPFFLFFFFFFKCLGVWTQDRKHTDYVLYHWATPIASRNINKQLVFPGTMLHSEDRNWYILVI